MIIGPSYINKHNSMYPSSAYLFDRTEIGDLGYFHTNAISTTYGYVLDGEVTLSNSKTVKRGEYFCLWTQDAHMISYTGKMVAFDRIGFKGQNTIGGPLEEKGRLSYIDGCSDSLLIYPPRQGDPSLNMLHFPPNTKQSFHTHPSLRFGIVASGFGYASLVDGDDEVSIKLEPGMMFCIEEQEKHRFVTDSKEMVVLAYHPDGDWGPTDHNHTMLNRTYLTK